MQHENNPRAIRHFFHARNDLIVQLAQLWVHIGGLAPVCRRVGNCICEIVFFRAAVVGRGKARRIFTGLRPPYQSMPTLYVGVPQCTGG